MGHVNEPTDVFKYIDMRGPDECWPWIGAWGGRPEAQRPYFQANGRRTMAYRWVLELTQGSVDGKCTDTARAQRKAGELLVLHSCDRGGYPIGCCNPKHLSFGGHQENMNDMKRRERHGMPGTVVRAIRRLLGEGRTQAEIAALYGVSRETVSAIATQRVYGHVAEVPPQKDQPDG